MLQQVNYNPDVLTCIANLSNDEVFTPPKLANDILDLLPTELWSNPDAKFLDPVSKSGVFLREMAKRLMEGLKNQIPDKQERINHIFENQLYGIAITELTSLLSRRTVYCSKTANGKYSVCETFDDEQGNIIYERIQHTWDKGKCTYCSASQDVYERDEELETHAYNFIHTENPIELFKTKDMKFDVIVGNPPYQLSDGGGMQTGSSSGSAIPLYHKFIQQAKKLKPRYLSMIIPARWYSGGRGLGEFRNEMLNDNRIKHIVDFIDSRDCFPGVDIAGGVCYFLWDGSHNGKCKFISKSNKGEVVKERDLNEFEFFIRDNIAVDIIHKIIERETHFMSDVVFSSNPFGFRSFFKGAKSPKKIKNPIEIITSRGVDFVEEDDIRINKDEVPRWKVILSKASSEHAGQTDKEGKRKVFSRVEVLKPKVICSETYLVISAFDNKREAENLALYVKSNFFRFLVSSVLLTQNIAKDKFCFVPIQDFNEPWTDEKLYAKYGLNDEEIAFIDSMIRPMDISNE